MRWALEPCFVDSFFSQPPTVLVGTHPTRTDLIGVDVENVESSAASVARRHHD